MTYLETIKQAFSGYLDYLIKDITFQSEPWYQNYFWWLVLLSGVVFFLEVIMPWRKNQKVIRRDFWLDLFYVFFNYFLFSLIIYNALSEVGVKFFSDVLGYFGVENLVASGIESLPLWAHLLVLFVVADFVQWNTHRLLHRVPWLWNFHKLHHSVKEMGFAAHLRFHWMETIVYKTIQFIPLSLLGFSIVDMFIIHTVTLFIGHLNHANLGWDYGLLKYILNNPKMHIWHHAKELPKGSYGVNFGLTLSVWDYLFKTAHIPEDGKDIELGFEGDNDFPQDFSGQMLYPFKRAE